MPLQQLPAATSRLLGSGQAISTPASLVKELIDNSLDANATSVDIILSPNILDRIEVRDNGHGIDLQDLEVLGRRGYTSKLRSFEELRFIGGSRLGFRGEALASAAELGEVTVMTRTEGETIGTMVKLYSSSGKSLISHPVGTSISVSNFYSKLAVRRASMLKDIPKMLSQIKDLIHTYAVLRLNIRFNLSMTRSSKHSWNYTPRPRTGLKEVISQVIGRETAAQCVGKCIKFTSHLPASLPDGGNHEFDASTIFSDSDLQRQSGQEYIIRAFLPDHDSDVSKINKGQYISIDSRPVSCARGSPKKIISIYKTYVEKALHIDSMKNARSPFLWMNIVCPRGSYDPNVEPTKDTVLFEDEDLIIRSVEEMFKSIYLRDQRGQESSTEHGAGLLRSRDEEDDVLSMSTIGQHSSDHPSIVAFDDEDQTSASGRFAHRTRPAMQPQTSGNKEPQIHTSSMSNIFEDYGGSISSNGISQPFISKHQSDKLLPEQADEPDNGLNPWIIAKLNTQVLRHGRDDTTVNNSLQEKLGTSKSFGLPTPRGSSEEPASLESLQAPREKSSLGYHGSSEPISLHGLDNHSIAGHTKRLQETSHGHTAVEAPLHGSDTSQQSEFLREVFAPPPLNYKTSPLRPRDNLDRHVGSEELTSSRLSHVRDALDFEKRKQLATYALRRKLKSQKPPQSEDIRVHLVPSSMASTDLQEPFQPRYEMTPEMYARDRYPRSNVGKQHVSQLTASREPKESPRYIAKPSVLPLEKIPEHSKLHDVSHKIQVTASHLKAHLGLILSYDGYAHCGNQNMSLKSSDLRNLRLDERVIGIAKLWLCSAGGKITEKETQVIFNNL